MIAFGTNDGVERASFIKKGAAFAAFDIGDIAHEVDGVVRRGIGRLTVIR